MLVALMYTYFFFISSLHPHSLFLSFLFLHFFPPFCYTQKQAELLEANGHCLAEAHYNTVDIALLSQYWCPRTLGLVFTINSFPIGPRWCQ